MLHGFFKSCQGVNYVTDLNCKIINMIDENKLFFYFEGVKVDKNLDVTEKIDAVVLMERKVRLFCQNNNWMHIYAQMIDNEAMIEVLFSFLQ